jgi:hypothetical protein
MEVLNIDFIDENILFKQQYLFVYNPEGARQVNILLHFEQIEKDWAKLAKLSVIFAKDQHQLND